MANLLKGMGLMGAGAYGYQQAQSTELLGTMSNVAGLFGGSTNRGSPASSSGGTEEMRVLQNEVGRLSQLLGDVVRSGGRSGQPLVIQTDHGRSGWGYIVYPVAGVGLVYVYCRVRGISMWDLLYVSQNSMTQFKTTVTEGFSRLWEEARKQKEELCAQMGLVARKQDQLVVKQEAMDERLRSVGDNVDDVKANTHSINFRVTMLDGKLAEVRDGMTNVQQGIMLLVQTVAEVTNRIGMHNTRSSQQLKGFLAGGTPTGPPSQSQLPSSQVQQLQPGLSSSSGGLNLLLDGAAGSGYHGEQAGDGAPTPPAPSARDTQPTATAYVSISGGAPSAGDGGGYGFGGAGDVSGRGGGGPPSFPKAASVSAGGRSGAFWGMGRS